MYLGRIDNTPSYRKYLWLFFLIAAGFLIFIFDYSLSRVTIKIYPQNVTQTVKVPVVLDQRAATADLGSLTFPAKIVEKDSSIEGTFASTGTKTEEGFAGGRIAITNKKDSETKLPQGYKLIHGDGPVAGQAYKDKIVFALDNDVAIPANGTIETTVTAINKGQRGDIEPSSLYFVAMAQWNRERILPKAIEMFSGGKKETKIISAQDVEDSKAALLQKAKAESAQYFSNQLASDKACPEQLTYVYVNNFSVSDPIGETRDNFYSKLEGKTKAIILPSADIKEALKQELMKEHSTSELVRLEDESLNLFVKSMDMENGKAEIEASLSGVFAPKFSSDVFDKSGLVGFNLAAIKQRYANNEAIEKVEADFFPFWRKTVPSLEDHVFIEIKRP